MQNSLKSPSTNRVNKGVLILYFHPPLSHQINEPTLAIITDTHGFYHTSPFQLSSTVTSLYYLMELNDPHYSPSPSPRNQLIFQPHILSQITPMDISPISKQESPMETEPKDSKTSPPKAQKPAKTEETKSEGKESKKRKISEVEQEDWQELGEPILKRKSLKETRIAQRCHNYFHGLCINREWCEASKFVELLDILEFQGWVELFSTCYNNVLAYDILDEFCKNFKRDTDGVCRTKIKKKDIIFDAEDIAEAFGVPNEGFDNYFKGGTGLVVEGVTIGEIVKSIGGSEKSVKTNHIEFSPLQTLLFHFVWQGIVPRTQHRHEANHLDAILMYCMEHKIKINFPSIFIQHLSNCIEKEQLVPYGNLIMTLLESYDISALKYEHLKLKTNHFIQPRTLQSWNLGVKDGHTYFLVETKNKPAIKEAKQEKEEEKELKLEVVEDSVKEETGEEQGKKKRGRKGTRKVRPASQRKSTRLASKPAEKVVSTSFLNLDDSHDEEVEVESKVDVRKSSSPTFVEELKGIKEALVKNASRMEILETMVSNLAASNKLLTNEVKDGMVKIAQGQEELKNRLNEMVLESKSDDDEEAVDSPQA